MPSARIHSVEVLKEAKEALVEFTDAVAQTLASVDADINRVSQWLTQDRPAYWKAQIRKREDEVARIQQDIMRKRIIAAPEPASVVEEQKKLDRARRCLASAQQRLQNVKRWAPIWDREAMLYKTSCRGLAEAVHRDMPAAAVRLDGMMDRLEEYLRLMAPQTDSDLPPESLPPEEGGPISALQPPPRDQAAPRPPATP